MSDQGILRPGGILGPRLDLAIFTGPILAALIIIWAMATGPGLDTPLAPWAFALLIVGCDVSHVWATGYRVYFDSQRFKKRPGLFLGVPLACFGAGVVLYAGSALLFWRILAYLAIWHFIRQQWGWIAYSRRAAGEGRDLDLRIDQVAIYNATLYPLLFWHAHLPRAFVWFVPGDFAAGVAPAVADVAFYVHWALNACYLLHQVRRWLTGRGVNIAKLHIWATTWFAWYGGIVIFNSDWAFTTLNVLAHGIPYLVVVNHVERVQRKNERGFLAALFRPRAWLLYLGILVLIGFTEEYLWDRLVWHDHPTLFPGEAVAIGSLGLTLLVPLLTIPQATHYVLDGWIWKFRSNPDVAEVLVGPRA